MTIARTLWALAGAIALSAAHGEEIAKCRSARGATIYTDVPCGKMGATSIGSVDATPNEVKGLRKPASRGAAPSPTATALEARRRRQNELGVIINGRTTTREQKEAAHEELAKIGALGTCKLTGTDRTRRDAAYSDLGSAAAERRASAMDALRAVLASCERL